jgi:hypothetical protein
LSRYYGALHGLLTSLFPDYHLLLARMILTVV